MVRPQDVPDVRTPRPKPEAKTAPRPTSTPTVTNPLLTATDPDRAQGVLDAVTPARPTAAQIETMLGLTPTEAPPTMLGSQGTTQPADVVTESSPNRQLSPDRELNLSEIANRNGVERLLASRPDLMNQASPAPPSAADLGIPSGLRVEMRGVPTGFGAMPMPTVVTDQAGVDEGNRLTRRKMLDGADGTEPVDGNGSERRRMRDVEPMSWEEYNALSDRQRAAIDFNTSLVQAVRRDKRLNRNGGYDDVSDTERNTYNSAVSQMFGADRGSDLYAPETLGLLNTLKLEDSSADLDDFLQLKVAITEDDLKNLGTPAAGPVPSGEAPLVRRNGVTGPSTDPMLDYQNELIDSTRALQSELAKGGAMLNNWRKTSLAATHPQWMNSELTPGASTIFGGVDRDKFVLPAGFGVGVQETNGVDPNAERNYYFQSAFSKMAKMSSADEVQNQLNVVRGEVADGDWPVFVEYMNTRLDMAKRYNAPLGEGNEYRSVDELRTLINAGG